MAARTDAAAHGSPSQRLFLSFLLLFVYLFHAFLSNIGFAYTHYTHQNLIDIGFQYQTSVSRVFQHTHNIPENIARPEGSLCIVLDRV